VSQTFANLKVNASSHYELELRALSVLCTAYSVASFQRITFNGVLQTDFCVVILRVLL